MTIKKFLDNLSWPPKLAMMTNYPRLHDDHDGEYIGHLVVTISNDGDAWISIPDSREAIRFRTLAGGGQSIYIRELHCLCSQKLYDLITKFTNRRTIMCDDMDAEDVVKVITETVNNISELLRNDPAITKLELTWREHDDLRMEVLWPVISIERGHK